MFFLTRLNFSTNYMQPSRTERQNKPEAVLYAFILQEVWAGVRASELVLLAKNL